MKKQSIVNWTLEESSTLIVQSVNVEVTDLPKISVLAAGK